MTAAALPSSSLEAYCRDLAYREAYVDAPEALALARRAYGEAEHVDRDEFVMLTLDVKDLLTWTRSPIVNAIFRASGSPQPANTLSPG